MTVKITFLMRTPKEKYDDVISNIQRIDGLELKEDTGKKGNIICSVKVPDGNAERTANICGSMCNIEGVDSIQIFVSTMPDKKTEKVNNWMPYIPMILSSTVTFFMIFSVLITLEKDTDPLEVFKLAGIPTIVVFLSQLGYATQELWLRAIKNIPSK